MKIPRVLLPCLALLGLLWLGVAQALPTVDEVQAATRRGDYAGAETLMREVVAARPDSARAHYVLAEILAHQRKFDEAAGQARRARALDPAIKFTEPARFDDFERLLQREQAAAKSAAASTAAPLRPAPVAQAKGGGVPTWLLLGGAIVFVGLAAGWMRRRAAEPAAPLPAGGVGAVPGLGPQAYGAGVPPVPPVTGGGSGLLGVGLAAAGGVAAGMLAEKLLHEGHDAPTPREHDATGGGLIPGSFDADSAADELARRDVEFGSGDGWGGRDTGLGGEDW